MQICFVGVFTSSVLGSAVHSSSEEQSLHINILEHLDFGELPRVPCIVIMSVDFMVLTYLCPFWMFSPSFSFSIPVFFQLLVDQFAACSNKRLSAFMSLVLDPSAYAVDALSLHCSYQPSLFLKYSPHIIEAIGWQSNSRFYLRDLAAHSDSGRSQ